MVRTRLADPRTHEASTVSSKSRATLTRNKPGSRPKYIEIHDQRLPVSVVLDTLFSFMAERHRIFNRRVAGEPRPWTEDEILDNYPFTNVFRIYDRTTQYILRHVIREGSQDLHEACFRVILFRFFNKIGTWKFLRSRLGELTWRDYDVKRYEEVLSAASQAIYGHAYILPAPTLGAPSNIANHLRLIELLMEENLPEQLLRFRYLKDAHGWLSLFPSMGDFTALQLLLDLNMLPFFGFSEDEWVALGPGAIACIRKIFGPTVRGREYEAFKYLYESQHEHFSRLGIPPDRRPRLCANRRTGVTMVDLEHSLCECDKYSRARHPDIKGKKLQVAKHIFNPDRRPPTTDIPEHWMRTDRRARKLTRPPPVDPRDPEPVYETSHIVAQKGSRLLVRWVGYGPDDDTWQSEKDFGEARAVMEQWKGTRDRIGEKVEEFRAMGDHYRKRKHVMVAVEREKYQW